MKTEPLFLVVDLFCGAGGTTTGFEMSDGISKVIACVNHDKNAIKSHWLNHPDVVHFEEDIRTLKLGPLLEIVKKYRKLYPDAELILWASLECTNFSKAKGGLPRDADSRTLADELERYIVVLDPDIIQIENVVEFMSWGALDERGKPISKQNGSDWLRWRKEICQIGYVDEWKQLNAADYGAYTSRNRLFGMFSKEKELIIFPEPTHCKNPSTGKMFAAPEKWKPVKEVLDLEDEGNSIFTRIKALSENTLMRIYAGLIKYIACGDKWFIKKYYSGRPAGKVISINGPAGTIRTVDGQALVQAKFLLKYNSVNKDTGVHIPPSIEEPAPVIATQNRLGIVNTCFLTKYHGTGANIHSIDSPSSTLSTKDRLAKVQPIWLDKHYSGKDNHQSVDVPAGSIMTKDKYSIIKTHWMDRNFNNGGGHQPIDQPSGSVLSVPKLNLVRCERFLMNTNYNNIGSDLNSPSPTLTASRRHQYLVNPQYNSNGSSIEKPCFTLIARMDKKPPYIVTTESGEMAIEVFETDSEIMVKIKEFMAAYGIIDIKMRMLKVPELLRIQGFPNEYKLHGNQTQQKKFIGNSVHPLVVKQWIKAIAERKRNLVAA